MRMIFPTLCILFSILALQAQAGDCLGNVGGIEGLCPLPDTPRPRATAHEMMHLIPSKDGSHEVFQAVCSSCHHWNIVATSPKEDWTATITNMKHNGANIPDDYRRLIINYLNENYSLKKKVGN